MRDVKLNYTEGVGFDIDIIDGMPEYVDYENQTEDQRAAIGAVIVQGTIPGALNIGVGWSRFFSQDKTLLDIDNEARQMINTVAGGTGQAGSSYSPLYIPKDKSLSVVILKGELA